MEPWSRIPPVVYWNDIGDVVEAEVGELMGIMDSQSDWRIVRGDRVGGRGWFL